MGLGGISIWQLLIVLVIVLDELADRAGLELDTARYHSDPSVS